MTNVNYRVLKSNIIKACKSVKGGDIVDFKIDFKKLCELVEDINLTPMCVGMNPVKMIPEIIPFMSEYFDKSHMEWLSDSKYHTTIAFIDSEYIDEKAAELLEKLKMPKVDDPDNDKVQVYAELVANYPCYFATIVSYKNNAPKVNRPSFEIACRANKVTIKMSDYQYNHKDF